MLHGVLIKEGKLKVVDIKDKLDTYYDILECRCIDIVERRIGDIEYSIVCDDEGLYNEAALISMMHYRTHQPMLVGNLFICKHGRNGELKSLSDEDVKNVEEHFKFGCVWGAM